MVYVRSLVCWLTAIIWSKGAQQIGQFFARLVRRSPPASHSHLRERERERKRDATRIKTAKAKPIKVCNFRDKGKAVVAAAEAMSDYFLRLGVCLGGGQRVAVQGGNKDTSLY